MLPERNDQPHDPTTKICIFIISAAAYARAIIALTALEGNWRFAGFAQINAFRLSRFCPKHFGVAARLPSLRARTWNCSNVVTDRPFARYALNQRPRIALVRRMA
jgi:hypothetical protein